MIPLSTACGDPKWYHNFKDKSYTFFDKNNVINGLRAEMLHPGKECSGLCGGKDICRENGDYQNCMFLKVYKIQLDGVDFNDFWKRCMNIAAQVRTLNQFKEEPIIVLMVHEAWYNPCSERVTIQNWIKSHGYDCPELPYVSGKFKELN